MTSLAGRALPCVPPLNFVKISLDKIFFVCYNNRRCIKICACSSVDRAPASGAGCVGSIPIRRTKCEAPGNRFRYQGFALLFFTVIFQADIHGWQRGVLLRAGVHGLESGEHTVGHEPRPAKAIPCLVGTCLQQSIWCRLPVDA